MRAWIIFGLLAVAGSASASFDLMLLGDNTTVGAAKVVRYDPVSGASFGSFGLGYFTGPINSITADGSTGRCYVQSVGNIYTFNYSTGEYLGVFVSSSSYQDIHFDSTTSSIIVGAGNGSGVTPCVRYDPATGSTISTFTASFISTAPLERAGSSKVFSYGLIGSSTIGMYAFNSAGGSATASFDTGIPFASNVTARQAVFVGTKFYGVFGDGSTYSRYYSMNTTTTGFTGALTTTNFGTSFAGTTSIANGHGNLLYLRCGNQLTLVDPVAGVTLGTRTLPIASANNVGGMAVILAPEPSTWIGMAAGAIGIVVLRRRRKI